MPPLPPPSPLTLLHTSVRALRLPGHALRAGAEPVDFDAVPRDVRAALAGGLAAALFRGPVGAGLAAPMLGVGLRVIIDAADGPATAMFNPRIEESSGRMVAGEEGNLCLPGVRAEVRRAERVTVSWQTLAGQARTETFEGWRARVLQHEIEILDGRLFLDHEGVQPLGTTPTPEAQAEQAIAALSGEPEPERRRVEPVAVATFDPALWQLEPITVRPPAAPGTELDPKFLRALAHGLFREQYERGGVGLAAPQVGLGLRVAAVHDRVHAPVLLHEPEILDRSDETEVGPEGCLSLPGWKGPVERHVAIKVRNHTLEGEPVDLEFEGYEARVVQHELDHMDGVLFTDRMAPDAELVPYSGPPREAQAVAEVLRDATAPPSARTRPKRRR